MLAKVRSLTEDCSQVGHIRFPLLELDFFCVCDGFLCNLLYFTFLFQVVYAYESSSSALDFIAMLTFFKGLKSK